MQNFVRLYELSKKGGFAIKPRTPLIPGINDDDAKMLALAEFYQENKVKKAALLKNNPIWFGKLEKIGAAETIAADNPMRNFYDQERYDRAKKIFVERGIEIFES